MTFTATHARALTGSDLAVTATAGSKETIAQVTITLDGEVLEDLELATGTETYSRSFSHVGQSAPGMDHTLIVLVMDATGAPHGATTRWSDS